MSASREKKQRVAQAANGPTEKERRAAEAARKERSKTILYTVVGVVLAVLVIALRMITREDLKLVPKGETIARILHIR